jgi:hypothetical protein
MILNRLMFVGEDHYEKSYNIGGSFSQRDCAFSSLWADDRYENDIHLSNESCQGSTLKA